METFVPYHHLFSNTCRTLYIACTHWMNILGAAPLQTHCTHCSYAYDVSSVTRAD